MMVIASRSMFIFHQGGGMWDTIGTIIGIVWLLGGSCVAYRWMVAHPPKNEPKKDEDDLGGIGTQYPFKVPRGIGRGRG
jgi:hypothetical protein